VSRETQPPRSVRRWDGALRLSALLGWRDTRRQPLGPLLLGITVAVAAASLTLVFEVGPAANAPWDATWRAAGSPDVVVVGAAGSSFDEVLAAAEVTDVAGPFPLVYDSCARARTRSTCS
jgi:hypothetical protein